MLCLSQSLHYPDNSHTVVHTLLITKEHLQEVNQSGTVAIDEMSLSIEPLQTAIVYRWSSRHHLQLLDACLGFAQANWFHSVDLKQQTMVLLLDHTLKEGSMRLLCGMKP